jgi:hypothetical protein
VRRRKLAEQLVEDLVNGRVSHARAAVETRKLYERQKGGWLVNAILRPKAETVDVGALPLPVPSGGAREAFDHALRAHHDVSVPVPVDDRAAGDRTNAPASRNAPAPGERDPV